MSFARSAKTYLFKTKKETILITDRPICSIEHTLELAEELYLHSREHFRICHIKDKPQLSWKNYDVALELFQQVLNHLTHFYNKEMLRQKTKNYIITLEKLLKELEDFEFNVYAVELTLEIAESIGNLAKVRLASLDPIIARSRFEARAMYFQDIQSSTLIKISNFKTPDSSFHILKEDKLNKLKRKHKIAREQLAFHQKKSPQQFNKEECDHYREQLEQLIIKNQLALEMQNANAFFECALWLLTSSIKLPNVLQQIIQLCEFAIRSKDMENLWLNILSKTSIGIKISFPQELRAITVQASSGMLTESGYGLYQDKIEEYKKIVDYHKQNEIFYQQVNELLYQAKQQQKKVKEKLVRPTSSLWTFSFINRFPTLFQKSTGSTNDVKQQNPKVSRQLTLTSSLRSLSRRMD